MEEFRRVFKEFVEWQIANNPVNNFGGYFNPEKNPLGFIIFFILMWITISYFLAVFGGWRRLSQVYKRIDVFNGKVLSFQSGTLGNVSYGNAISVGANQKELFLGMFFIFKVGHPDLVIPLTEVTGREIKRFIFLKYVELNFKEVPRKSLQITKKLADFIVTESNQSWKYDTLQTDKGK